MGEHLVGVIADTHGLVREEALQALRGTELIVHAGDIGSYQVLEALRKIAPVIAVRGNVDRGEWAETLHQTEVVAVGQVCLYVLHDVGQLDLDPAAAGFHGVISGHSHRPVLRERGKVVYLNPGSAGPRRFALPVSLGILRIQNTEIKAELIELAG